MSSAWTANDIRNATNGQFTDNDWSAERFSIDSRSIEKGDVFIAIVGESLDGHNYVAKAFEKGAVAAVVHYLVEGVDPARQVLVDDTMEALRELAIYQRNRLKATLVGVTGSVGKTGTKEALRIVLSTKGKTYASHGNFNNHIGTPLCMINMPLDSEFGVFEMGMNHAGEMSQLSVLVRPHLAIITTVESVHLEFFGSEAAIADAKAEIFDGMDKNGIATLPADNPHFVRLKAAAEKHGLGRVISFGVNEMAICRMMDYRTDAKGSEVVATISGTQITYRMGTIGRHWALGSVAVLASADALGCDLPKAAAALAGFREPKGRGRLTPLLWGSGEPLMLVDDSYNASPSSMTAAFRKMKELKTAEPGHRTVALLGDMLELGDLAPKLHSGLVEAINDAKIDIVHTAGPLMENLHKALPDIRCGLHAETAEKLLDKVHPLLKAGDIVLVKGSHGSKMWQLAEKLEAMAGSGEREQVTKLGGAANVV